MARTITPFVVPLCRSRLWLGALLLMLLCLLPALLMHAHGLALLPLPWLLWRALAADGWLPGMARPERVEVTAQGQLRLLESGLVYPAELRDQSVALPGLIVLNLLCAGRRRAFAIFADSAPAEAQRQLRVFLRWYAYNSSD
jgi:hypothetical protein